jgi:hypothetical protein
LDPSQRLSSYHWSWRQPKKRCRCVGVRNDAVLVCGMQLFYQRRRYNTRKAETSTHVPAAGQQEARRPASSQATTSTRTRVDQTRVNSEPHTHIHTHSQTHKHTLTHSHTHLNHQGVQQNALVMQRSGCTWLRRGPSKLVLWCCWPCGDEDGVDHWLGGVGGRRRS